MVGLIKDNDTLIASNAVIVADMSRQKGKYQQLMSMETEEEPLFMKILNAASVRPTKTY